MEFTNEYQIAGRPYFYDGFKTFSLTIPLVGRRVPFLLVDAKSPYLVTMLLDINRSMGAFESDGIIGYLACNPVGAANYKKLGFIMEYDPAYVYDHVLKNDDSLMSSWIGAIFFPSIIVHKSIELAMITRKLTKINGCVWMQFRLGHRPGILHSWYDLPENEKDIYRPVVDMVRGTILTGLESGRYSK